MVFFRYELNALALCSIQFQGTLREITLSMSACVALPKNESNVTDAETTARNSRISEELIDASLDRITGNCVPKSQTKYAKRNSPDLLLDSLSALNVDTYPAFHVFMGQ